MSTHRAGTDWVTWHRAYDDPGSALSRRLARVQARVAQALQAQPPGPVRLLSMCAGQGRDVVEPLAASPRRHEATALLVEADPELAADAAARAGRAGLEGVRVVVGDAGETGVYAPAVPAGIALVCGVFGNVPDDDVARTVTTLPSLLAPGGWVVWTRSRRPPDLTPAVRSWFTEHGFEEAGFDPDDDSDDPSETAVGTHVLRGPTASYEPGVRMFRFA